MARTPTSPVTAEASSGKSRTVGAQPTAGFTLVEMLVVLLIMSLLVGLVATHVPPRNASPSEVARETGATLRVAHARALREGRSARITFDLANRTMLLDGQVVRRWPETVRATIDTSDAESADGLQALRFTPDGGSSGLRAVFEAEGAKTSVLTVSWLTGEVRDEAP